MKNKLMAIPLSTYTYITVIGCAVWLLLSIAVTVIAEKKENEKAKRAWQTCNAVLACLIGALILYMALFSRNPNAQRRINLKPLSVIRKIIRSKAIRWEKLTNVYVFIPYTLTAAGGISNVKRKYVIAASLGIITSLVIEMLQYIFIIGYCETDDFIANSAGATIGALICFASDRISACLTIQKERGNHTQIA